MAGSHLPAEVLEKLFGFLCKDDVVSCSGVNTLWYEAAKRLLTRKYGIQLCRRFDRISAKARDVWLAGDQAVRNFPKRKFRKLVTLRVQYDEPAVLQTTSLRTIFGFCKNLKHLALLNLTYLDENEVNVILENFNPGLELRLSVRDRWKSKEALCALVEHRELFQGILVEHDNVTDGWFPTPVENSKFVIPESSRTVSLECTGLKDIECSNFNSLKTLKLVKCFIISETSLYTISRLNLKAFSIEGCSAREATWLGCFKFGFLNMSSVSITKCDNLTPTVIELLGTKNLIKIELEINKYAETGLPHLYKSNTLESLHIITNQIITNSIHEGVEKHWPRLKRLQVEESLFLYDETLRHIDALERLSQFKQIEFTYFNNPTKVMEISPFKSRFQS